MIMKSTREATREELIDRIKELDATNYRVNKNLLETAEKLETEKRKYHKLFDAYNQRVSDILELEKKLEDLENGDLTTVYLSGFYDGEKKFKDKIKARIKELEREKEKLQKEQGNIEEMKIYSAIDIIKAEILRYSEILEEK